MVEATGATIMVVGGAAALVGFAIAIAGHQDGTRAYQQLRQRLGRSILNAWRLASTEKPPDGPPAQ